MGNRKIKFTKGEFYHIYNRGVDKRDIFLDKYYIERFFQSMNEFNSVDPVGSIHEKSFKNDAENQLGGETSKLVKFVSYCLNSNHYHFILEQLVDDGISEFMKRLGGYTYYFNKKNNRSGSLFQGVFKSKHINSNEYLLHLSVYVNLNYKVHQSESETIKLMKSSWEEYVGGCSENFCSKDIILNQFKNIMEYKLFAEESLKYIQDRKKLLKDILID